MDEKIETAIALCKMSRSEFNRHRRPLAPEEIHISEICGGDLDEVEIASTIARADAARVAALSAEQKSIIVSVEGGSLSIAKLGAAARANGWGWVG